MKPASLAASPGLTKDLVRRSMGPHLAMRSMRLHSVRRSQPEPQAKQLAMKPRSPAYRHARALSKAQSSL